MFALQGPRALDLLRAAGTVENMPARFHSARCVISGRDCLAGRTGYTGEDGVEIFVPRDAAPGVWEKILSAGSGSGGGPGIEVGPVGLAARDSLRFEPAFALYGHELSENVTPVEAGLMWACDMTKSFTGRDAIAARKAEGPREKLVTFEMLEKSVPREGFAVVDESGTEAGRVVSGMFAPTVGKFAGNAYVRPDLAPVGKTFYIVIRDARKKAGVVKRPLYVPAYRT
jgi:glycine cleavage system T protein